MYDNNTQIKEFLMSVVKSTPHGVITIDLQGKITLANSPVLECLNLNGKLYNIIDNDFLELISHIPRLKNVIEECLSVSRKSFNLDKVLVNDQYLKIKGRKILDGLLITIENITHEVKIQNALLKSKKELEEFAEVSAHDIKSHVTSLAGLIDLLDQENAVKNDFQEDFERVKMALSMVSDKVKTLNEIIDFHHTLNLKPKQVSLQDELNQVMKDISDLIEASDASIEADFSECTTVKLPPVHVRNIFYNLITNGIKFKKENVKPVVKVQTHCNRKYTIIEITDNGIGFPVKQQQDKMFKLFQKFNTNVPGMGVGLYLVNEITTAYEGKIEISSEIDNGTTFKIYLKNG